MKKAKILEYLEIVAPYIPTPLYWLDKNNRILGGNEIVRIAIGGYPREQMLGLTPYDYYPFEIADKIIKHNNKVMKTKQTLSQEEMIKNITTGQIKYFMAIKSPLYDDDGKVIGTIGTSIDITAEKEAQLQKQEIERLKLENEQHARRTKKQAKLDIAFRDFQAAIIEYIDEDINVKPKSTQITKIVLTLRELQVLYALSYKTNSKSAANYLSKKLNKIFSHDSVNTVVSQHLYPKFEVNSVDALIDKAISLKLIPLFFPEQIDKKEKADK